MIGTKVDSTDEYEMKGWKFFDEAKIDEARDYIKTTFDTAVEDIKKIFE